jgi:hypothetical protein
MLCLELSPLVNQISLQLLDPTSPLEYFVEAVKFAAQAEDRRI